MDRELGEWTVLRAWMQQWLRYVQWYVCVALSPTVTFEDLLDPPIVNRRWRVTTEDPAVVKFGLLDFSFFVR